MTVLTLQTDTLECGWSGKSQNTVQPRDVLLSNIVSFAGIIKKIKNLNIAEGYLPMWR